MLRLFLIHIYLNIMNIISIVFLIIIAIISFIFLIRSKLIHIMSLGLRIGFVSFIVIALTALFIPAIYNKVADLSLKGIGIHSAIVDFDDTIDINSFTEAPGDIVDTIINLFGGTSNDTNSEETNPDDIGYLEDSLYPLLVDLISFLYRSIAAILSLLGLIVIVYLSYATSGVTDNDALMHNYAILQQRVENLERLLQAKQV